MEVHLIDYTGAGTPNPARYAANLLTFVKSTRLEMRPSMMKNIEDMTNEAVYEQLDYVARTVPSSWEFIHYTFTINDVTRAFTHQLVRTRTASYAQQAMRIQQMKCFAYGIGPTVQEGETRKVYEEAMQGIQDAYDKLIDMGCDVQDARGLLPTNIHTNINMSLNLRALVDLVRKRSSTRVQDEYRDVARMMRERVEEVHPWAAKFFERTVDTAGRELEQKIMECELPLRDRIDMVKLIDQMRS